MHEIFNYTLASFSSTEVRLHRQYINSSESTTAPSSSPRHPHPHPNVPEFKSVDLILSIPSGSSAKLSVKPGTNGSFTPPTIDILLPHQRPTHQGVIGAIKQTQNHVRVQVWTNETSLAGLDVDELFLTPKEANTTTIKDALQSLPGNVTEQVLILF